MGTRWWALVVVLALWTPQVGADWDAAQAAYAAGNWELAASELEALLVDDGAYAPAHYLLGQARLRLGLTQAAAVSLARAVELAPDHVSYRLALVRAQLAAEQVEEAFTTLREVDLAAVPAEARGEYAQLVGATASRTSRSAEAVPLLEAATGEFPEDSFLWRSLGEARTAVGNEVGAFEAYAEAARLDTTDPTAGRAAALAAMRIANTLAESSDRALWYVWAAEYAERAATTSGGAEDAVVAGDALLGAGEVARAREWLERAVAADAGALALYLLSRALADSNELERAVESLARAIARSEDGPLRRACGYALVQVHERARNLAAAELLATDLGDGDRAAQLRALAGALAGAAGDPRVEECFERWVGLQGSREDARRHEGTPAWAALEARQAELLVECGEVLGLGK
jgi:predicted Zn-dependent protease